MNTEIDVIALEVIKNALTSIADEMALIIMRSAYSPIVRDSSDYSTAVCDSDGHVIAQGMTIPLHMGSFPAAMRQLTSEYAGRIEDGDIFAFNDPYCSGGMHLPDIYLVKPLFLNGGLEGFAVALAHQADLGGIAPGGTSPQAHEIFQEGLRIPTLKLFERGVPNETLFRIIETNTRLPINVLGDIKAQISAVNHAESSYGRLVEKYGSSDFRTYLAELHRYSERMMRSEIGALPDGEYTFTDHFEGLGETPEPVRICVKVTITGDELLADWTGTSPQVKGAVNCPVPYIYAAVYAAVRFVTDPSIPNFEGYMRPIRMIAPEGTVVNPLFPAACAARGVIGARALDCMLGALSQAVPERVTGASDGGPVMLAIAGWHNGRQFILNDCLLGSWGGSVLHDGPEGVAAPGVNVTNCPVETMEAEYPVEVIRYGLVADSGGAGKHRGALAILKEYRILADEASLTVRSDRRTFRPYGLAGGSVGSSSWNVINPETDHRVLPANPMEQVKLKRGDVFRHQGAGGGGYGVPPDRDPELVRTDVVEQKQSVDGARLAYGIVIDPETFLIDRGATDVARRRMKERPLDP